MFQDKPARSYATKSPRKSRAHASPTRFVWSLTADIQDQLVPKGNSSSWNQTSEGDVVEIVGTETEFDDRNSMFAEREKYLAERSLTRCVLPS